MCVRDRVSYVWTRVYQKMSVCDRLSALECAGDYEWLIEGLTVEKSSVCLELILDKLANNPKTDRRVLSTIVSRIDVLTSSDELQQRVFYFVTRFWCSVAGPCIMSRLNFDNMNLDFFEQYCILDVEHTVLIPALCHRRSAVRKRGLVVLNTLLCGGVSAYSLISLLGGARDFSFDDFFTPSVTVNVLSVLQFDPDVFVRESFFAFSRKWILAYPDVEVYLCPYLMTSLWDPDSRISAEMNDWFHANPTIIPRNCRHYLPCLLRANSATPNCVELLKFTLLFLKEASREYVVDILKFCESSGFVNVNEILEIVAEYCPDCVGSGRTAKGLVRAGAALTDEVVQTLDWGTIVHLIANNAPKTFSLLMRVVQLCQTPVPPFVQVWVNSNPSLPQLHPWVNTQFHEELDITLLLNYNQLVEAPLDLGEAVVCEFPRFNSDTDKSVLLEILERSPNSSLWCTKLLQTAPCNLVYAFIARRNDESMLIYEICTSFDNIDFMYWRLLILVRICKSPDSSFFGYVRCDVQPSGSESSFFKYVLTHCQNDIPTMCACLMWVVATGLKACIADILDFTVPMCVKHTYSRDGVLLSAEECMLGQAIPGLDDLVVWSKHVVFACTAQFPAEAQTISEKWNKEGYLARVSFLTLCTYF